MLLILKFINKIFYFFYQIQVYIFKSKANKIKETLIKLEKLSIVLLGSGQQELNSVSEYSILFPSASSG